MDKLLIRKKILSSRWSVWVGGISLFFVIATIINPYLPDSIRFTLPHHFDLSLEMNLATWWSAAILVTVALLAYELYFAEENRKTKPAWLILSFLLAGLSLDEVGSLHEGFSWGVLLVLIPLGGLFLVYALAILFRNESTRKPAIKIAVGFLLFGSVAVQEFIEHSVQWPIWAIGFRRGLEEGTELLGFYLILSALVSRRPSKTPAGSLYSAVPDPAKMKYLPVVALGSLAIHTIFSLLAPVLQDFYVGGNPVMWFPMAVYFLLFTAMVWKSTSSNAAKAGAWLLLAFFFLLNSVASFYLIAPRQSISRLYALGLVTNFYFFYACQLVLIAVFYRVFYREVVKKTGLLFLSLVALMTVGLFSGEPVAQLLLAGIFAYFATYLFLIRGGREESLGLKPEAVMLLSQSQKRDG